MLLIASAPRRISSVLMNEGAKVFEVGVPFFEFERCRTEPLLFGAMTPPNEEKDWCRMCADGWAPDNGEERFTDFGLP
jgi:hypothetical protein